MNQREAVIKAMKDLGGQATLKELYSKALQIEGCEWRTKTPEASIRRIVQNEKYFYKTKRGTWALKE